MDTRGIARKYGTGLKLTGGVLSVDLSNVTASVGNVMLPNSGAYGALTTTGAQRSLLKLDTSNRLILGDGLGDMLFGAGSASSISLIVGSSTRCKVDANNVELTASASGSVKVSFGSTEKFRLHNDGGLVVGSAIVGTALGAAGIGLDNNTSIYHRFSSSWIPSLTLGTSAELTLGDAANSQVDIKCGSSGSGSKTVRVYRGATKVLEIDAAVSADETSLQALINTIGFRRVKVGSSDGVVPGTARVLYVEA